MQAHTIFMLYKGRITLWDGALKHRVPSHSLHISEMCFREYSPSHWWHFWHGRNCQSLLSCCYSLSLLCLTAFLGFNWPKNGFCLLLKMQKKVPLKTALREKLGLKSSQHLNHIKLSDVKLTAMTELKSNLMDAFCCFKWSIKTF